MASSGMWKVESGKLPRVGLSTLRFGRRAGFTLVELLVVVAVIAMLAAMLAPVYLQTKKSGQRTRCQSNLSQIARAFESYTADYHGCYPNTGSQYLWAGYYWREPMRKYVVATAGADRNMILACPADPTPPGIYSGTSYAYSACFYMTPEQINMIADSDHIRTKFAATNPELPCSSIKNGSARCPSKKVLVAEYWTLHSDSPKVGWYDDLNETGNDPWSGERNYLFVDGHVRFLPTRRIRPAVSPTVDRARVLPDINLTRDGAAGRDVD